MNQPLQKKSSNGKRFGELGRPSQRPAEVRLSFYEDTDSLYIDLCDGVSAESREISDRLVVDYDADGNVVGFDIQHASLHLDLSRIETSHLPLPTAS